MTYINIKISKAVATAEKDGIITTGMVGVPVSFMFDSWWDGLIVTAVFKGSGAPISVPLLGATETVVPWEVLKRPSTLLRIGAEGRLPDGTLVIPTTWATVGIVTSGANATDDLAKPPTPTAFDRIMSQIGNMNDLATEDKSSLVAAVNEAMEKGGADITATAYGDGVISIGEVTGNIVITATAAKVIVSTDLIAEYGYRDGYRMSTSSGNFRAEAGYVAIGYPNAIPVGKADYPNGFVIEVTGANFNSSAHSNCTWAIYQGTDPTVTSGAGGYIRSGTQSLNGVSTTVELSDNGIKWTFPVGLPAYTFLRFAGYGSGANLTGTITPKEPIEQVMI